MAESKLSKNLTVSQNLAISMARNPDAEALVFENQHVTYQELGRQVNALAHRLRELGVQRGDRVAVLLPNCPEFIYAFFAIPQAGGVVVPLYPLLRRRELQHTLGEAEAVVVILQADIVGYELLKAIQGLRAELPCLRQIIVRGAAAPEGTLALDPILAQPDPGPLPEVAGNDDLFGLFNTSGTTGLPKAVMHSHHTLLASTLGVEDGRQQGKPDPQAMQRFMTRYGARFGQMRGKPTTTLSPSPYHALAGWGSWLGALLQGGRVVILERFHPVAVMELVEKEKVNILVSAPSIFRLLLALPDFDRYDKSSLLYCVLGAEPASSDLAHQVEERFGCPIMIAFGATESGSGTLATRVGDPESMAYDTVGHVFGDCEVKVVDEARQSLPAGQVGELACKRDGTMLGYYKAPEATAAVLDAEGWYYTGDLAVMSEEGYVRIVGRKKDMIIRGGTNVYPVEIENFLLTHPDIQTVAVVGVPSTFGSESVWAFVEPRAGASLTPAQVITYCRGEIASYKLPDEVRVVESLPRTPTNKAQKYALREQALAEIAQRQSHR